MVPAPKATLRALDKQVAVRTTAAVAGGADVAVGGELLSSSVKRLLLDRIMRGYYKPGARIVELQVAKELGTSQSPVREALRDLAAIGIITIHSRRGARVRLPTSKELADISVVRSEIDALAASLAAPVMDQPTLDTLRDAYREMQEHYGAGDHGAMTQADARFHRVIANTSGNQAIEHVFDQLEPFARTFITLTLPTADVGSIISEHGRILDALEQGDALLAAHHARDHQLNVSALFRDHFDAQV
ncbi:GntR family transcriptional regulator [Nocardioides litoris]|uniref:GntR family transcriptional regulator n=1 Tax=Nocardioides litoris TaxID=1926648 RepID=UPI001123207F|nr:GntR family transcriptional regulator [Nocardioides litoris]